MPRSTAPINAAVKINLSARVLAIMWPGWGYTMAIVPDWHILRINQTAYHRRPIHSHATMWRNLYGCHIHRVGINNSTLCTQYNRHSLTGDMYPMARWSDGVSSPHRRTLVPLRKWSSPFVSTFLIVLRQVHLLFLQWKMWASSMRHWK